MRWKMTMIEPTLDDLLDDEIMRPVLRSAGVDAARLRASLAEAARRLGCEPTLATDPKLPAHRRISCGEAVCC